MKISISSVTFYQDSFEVFFEKISQHKYDAIELNAETLPWATPHLHDKTTDNELEKITYLSNRFMFVGILCISDPYMFLIGF